MRRVGAGYHALMASDSGENDPTTVPAHDPEPLSEPDPDNPDHPHGRDATLSGPTQEPPEDGPDEV